MSAKNRLAAEERTDSPPAGGGAPAPVCSVCIANYNGIDLIGSCLDSVLAQDFSLPVEIIVHDDASRDGSVPFIREHYPGVQLITSHENVGFCVSNNRMAEHATGEYLLLLNNDATLRSDAIKTLYEFASSQEMPGILGLPQYDMKTGELLDIGIGLDLFLNPFPNLDPKCRDVAYVMGACLWVPRSVWHELGGFPEWFHTHAEDAYLCCSARLRGYRVINLTDSGFDHRRGTSLGGSKLVEGRMRTTYRRRALAERNKSFTMFICYPSPYFQIIFPLHLALLALEGALVSCLNRDLTLWKQVYSNCMRELWSNRQKLRLHRQRAQRNAKCGAGFFRFHALMPQKLRLLAVHGLPSVE